MVTFAVLKNYVLEQKISMKKISQLCANNRRLGNLDISLRVKQERWILQEQNDRAQRCGWRNLGADDKNEREDLLFGAIVFGTR